MLLAVQIEDFPARNLSHINH
jgi:hypothetical protein